MSPVTASPAVLARSRLELAIGSSRSRRLARMRPCSRWDPGVRANPSFASEALDPGSKLVGKHRLAWNIELGTKNAAAGGFSDEETAPVRATKCDISGMQPGAATYAIHRLAELVDNPNRAHADMRDR